MPNSLSGNSEFVELEHQAFGCPRQTDQEERREEPRLPEFALRRIAPLRENQTPDSSDFFCVETRDLTNRGFSFFMATRPSFRLLAVALGTSEIRQFVTAEIIHCSDVMVHPSGLVETIGNGHADPPDAPTGPKNEAEAEAARRMILVGCRFTHR